MSEAGDRAETGMGRTVLWLWVGAFLACLGLVAFSVEAFSSAMGGGSGGALLATLAALCGALGLFLLPMAIIFTIKLLGQQEQHPRFARSYTRADKVKDATVTSADLLDHTKAITAPTPSTSGPSPGPGWWLASDNHWYPPEWLPQESAEDALPRAGKAHSQHRQSPN